MQTEKIVHLAERYWPDKGGVETHLHQVNLELIRRQYAVTVITRQTDPNQPLVFNYQGVQILRLPLISVNHEPKLYRKATWSQLEKFTQELESAHVIHVHDVVWWMVPFWRKMRGKMYATFHGWEGKYPVPWKNKLHRFIASKAVKKSIHVGDWIREFYWDTPNAVVYGGTNVRENVALYKNIEQAFPRIAFLGRLEPENDVSMYLELIESLRHTWPSLQMTWVGDGSLRADCEAVGKVTGMLEDPIPVVAEADFVFASSYLSMLESQALGKLVCAFYTHPLKRRYLETYPGQFHMITAGDVTEMKQTLIKILSNQNMWAEMAQQSRHFAETMTWPKVAETYLQLWDMME